MPIMARVLFRVSQLAQAPIAIDDSSTNPTMVESSVGLRRIRNRRPMARSLCPATAAMGRGIGLARAGLRSLGMFRFFHALHRHTSQETAVKQRY
jgi:hypothetical protein